MKKSRKNGEHYTWGDACSGWHLVNSEKLSVIEELMPANTQEKRHYHSNAQQFFYILKGIATFELNNEILKVSEREGIHISPGIIHQIGNDATIELEFLVISQPSTKRDRTEINIS